MSQRMAEAATPILPFCIRSPNCNTHAVLAAAKFLASAGAGATLRVGWWPMTRPDEVFPVDSPKDRRPWPNCNQLFCAVDSQRATRDPAPGRGKYRPTDTTHVGPEGHVASYIARRNFLARSAVRALATQIDSGPSAKHASRKCEVFHILRFCGMLNLSDRSRWHDFKQRWC